ncbi:SGNH/GDSL hydrolase family protein [Actinacidiphila guanduensis]|jgi:lysophospholipase L1-like esterase|uniref:Lysophospholipase L1 n=1 Tax=Actinacidiphila guanduensis TaxID=310781 RepID=A0A1H0HHG6_9ACTN|nr:SGNH/GDSL hydrolase family protein [Actinacidiphila guanduensis]SDO18635.1 Lysophospholipase L1 [Actinacidiphila guanduensis]
MTEDLSREAADPLCLSQEESARLLRGAPWQRFVAMGDSFAAGVGGPSRGYATVSWPKRVAAALGEGRPDFAYLNTGVIGKRTAEVRAEQLEQVMAFEPDLVNVAAGGNDIFDPEPDFDAVEENLDAVYTALRGRGADVFAFTVANVFDTVPELAEFGLRVAELNSRIRAVAARHDAMVVEMWDHPVRKRPELMSEDGIHFAMEGQAALAAEIVRTLSQRLSRYGAQGQVR